MIKKNKLEKGAAVILSVFIIGMAAVLIGTSQVKLGALESFRGRASARSLQAYYAANSGIEDAIKRIDNGAADGTAYLSIGGETNNVKVTIASIDADNKTITSIAKSGNFVRRIKVSIQKSLGFDYAIEADNGGIDMETNTHVEVNPKYAGESSDVWSNSYINGKSKKDTGTGSSEIIGNAYALGQIGCSDSSDKNCGVYVTKNAWGGNLKACTVNGIKYSAIEPAKECGGSTNWNSTNPKLPLSPKTLPSLGTSKTGTSVLTCTMTKTNKNCGAGEYKLGNLVVNGDLTIDTPGDVVVEIDGPLWITENLIIKPGVVVGLVQDKTDSEYLDSQKITVEGVIESSSNVTFKSNESAGKAAFLLFASTVTSPSGPSDKCEENVWDKGILKEVKNAISLSSNTDSVLFYAVNGCVLINQNADFYGAVIGKKVRLDQNSHIYYDPRLKSGSGGSSWNIGGFEEY